MALVELPHVKPTSPKLPSVKIKTEDQDHKKNTLLAIKRRLIKT